MASANQHVTRRSDGTWQVKTEGASKAYRVTNTQAEAISIGRNVSRNQNSELFIHGVDGKIRARDSHENDSFPPRDGLLVFKEAIFLLLTSLSMMPRRTCILPSGELPPTKCCKNLVFILLLLELPGEFLNFVSRFSR